MALREQKPLSAFVPPMVAIAPLKQATDSIPIVFVNAIMANPRR
jgi:hypothetical protein